MRKRVHQTPSKGTELKYMVEWNPPGGPVFLDNFGTNGPGFSNWETAINHIRMCQRKTRRYPARVLVVLGNTNRAPVRGEWIDPLPLEVAGDRQRW